MISIRAQTSRRMLSRPYSACDVCGVVGMEQPAGRSVRAVGEWDGGEVGLTTLAGRIYQAARKGKKRQQRS